MITEAEWNGLNCVGAINFPKSRNVEFASLGTQLLDLITIINKITQ